MTRRVFVHIGTPKTGTTYLQSLMWGSRAQLVEQGLLLPLDGVREHFYLSNIARSASNAIESMPPSGQTSWTRMVDEVGVWDGDALISHELFAACPAPRIRWVFDQLKPLCDEVHVIVTARDFPRQVLAEWQQSVKHGRTHTFAEYCAALEAEDPERTGKAGRHGSVLFWRVQDLPRLVEEWSKFTTPAHVHVVTVPSAGAPHSLLWERFASVLGLESGVVDISVTVPNESLGIDEIEAVRRVNLAIPAWVPRRGVQTMIKQVLAEGVLAGRPSMRRFVAPPPLHAWACERGAGMLGQLRETPCHVVGALDDLDPVCEQQAGPTPDDVDEAAVAKVATEAIAALLFSPDNFAGTDTAHDHQRLAHVVDRRTHRLDEVRALLREERAVLAAERAHPLRTYARRTGGRLKRSVARFGRQPDDA